MLNYGFPDRTYFELFEGTHPSRKIYSVQVKEWVKEFSKKEVFDRNHDMHLSNDEIVYKYEDVAAVVQVEHQKLENEASHLLVEPTADLIKFLKDRGVVIKGDLYVQPLAFDWVDDEKEIEEEFFVEIPDEPKKEVNQDKNKTKTIIAAAIAVLSLLS